MKKIFTLGMVLAFIMTLSTNGFCAEAPAEGAAAPPTTTVEAAPIAAPVAAEPEPEPFVSEPPPAPVAPVPAASESILFEEYMSLDDILKQPMGVSTLKEMTTREAPNIVTLITADEIEQTGARDLMDVLRLVPSFEFGADVSGVVGMGVRGLWAHEGKVLFLLDGQPINEIAYGTMAYGNHFPADQIQQIEIIRGPGSAIYGGYASLAVINVKTKNGKQIDGARTAGVYSQMNTTYSHRTVSLSVGKAIDDLDVSAHVFAGQGNRSEGTFSSYWGGEEYDMKTNAQLNPGLVNIGLTYKDLQVRSIIDQYHTTQRDWWGVNLPSAVRADFNTRILDAKYDIKIDNLTITPRVNIKEQEPYQRNGVGTKNIIPETYGPPPGDYPFEIWMKRQTQSLIASYDVDDRNNGLIGIEAYQETGETISDSNPRLVKYYNTAAFAQGLVDLIYVNLTAGARWERHNQYGDSFVPRAGITGIYEDLHAKLLFSRAFRVPQLETIELNPDIRPENSRTIEFETGYKITDKMMVTVNVFDTLISDVIIYYATALAEYQLNAGQLGAQGAELAYTYRDDWGFANLGYSYNQISKMENFIDPDTGLEAPSIYSVPDKSQRAIGLPGHKITLNAKIQILDFLSVNPSLFYMTERYGWEYFDNTNGVDVLKEFPAALVANLFVNYTPLPGLNLGVGVNDITDSKPAFIQGYYGGHAPIPGASRSYVGKVAYNVSF